VNLKHKFNIDIGWRNNLAPQWLSTIYVATISFVVSVLLARGLGVEGFGVYSYVLSLAGIFFIVQDGGYKTLIFRNGVDGYSKGDGLIGFGTGYLLLVTVSGVVIVMLFQPKYWLVILAAIICMSLVVLSEFVSSTLKGDGEFKLDALWKITIRTVSAIAILFVLFYYSNNEISYLFIAWTFALLVVLIWPLAKGWLRWPRINFSSDLFRDNMVFLTIDVATVFYFRSDIVLLEYYGHIEGDVGQYSAAYRILEGIILLATPVAQLSFRALRLKTDQQQFFRLLCFLLMIMLFTAILIIAMGMMWGSDLMVYVFGVQYKDAGALLPLLLFSVLFILPNYILTQGSIALNREKGYAKIVVGVAVLNVLLNMWLIPDFGATGAAWATIFAEGVLCLSLGWMIWGEWKEGQYAYRS
jgi:O-antigen/teichoic acid export membrane protein